MRVTLRMGTLARSRQDRRSAAGIVVIRRRVRASCERGEAEDEDGREDEEGASVKAREGKETLHECGVLPVGVELASLRVGVVDLVPEQSLPF